MLDIELEIKELEETQREMDRIAQELHGPPLVQAVRDATLMVQRDARINAPVDTGRLRASITPEVRARGAEVEGVTGSKVAYAPHQEYGTRYMPGRHYMQRALDDNYERIVARINRGVEETIG